MKKTCLLFLLLLSAVSLSAQFTWEHTNGPAGASAPFLCSNDYYAFASANSHLYRTPDGITWERLAEPVSIFVDAQGETVATLFFNESYDHAVLKVSHDNGDTWNTEEVPSTIVSAAVDLVVTSHGIYLFLYTQDRLYRSVDGGKNWTLAPHPNINAHQCRSIDNHLYLYHSKYLVRSDEFGNNWQNITPNLYPEEYIHDVASNGDEIVMNTTGHVADTVNGCFTIIGLVRHSHDNGQTWQFYPGIVGNSYNTLLAVDDVVFANSQVGFLKSYDFGATWDTVVVQNEYPGAITMTSIGNTPICGTPYKGILRWDEATQSLIESNTGIDQAPVYDLSKGEERIWAACGNGVFYYDVNSKTWSDKMELPDAYWSGYSLITSNDHGWVAAAGLYGDGGSRFYFSDNNGSTWRGIPVPGGVWGISPHLQIIGNYIYIIDDYGALRSADKGEHWEYVMDDYMLTEFVEAHGKFYVAGSQYFYTSADNGETWSSIVLPFQIFSLGAYNDDLFAVSWDEISELHLSTNGVDWLLITDGFPTDALPEFSEKDKGLFFRDANYYYAFHFGYNGESYRASRDDWQWSEFADKPYGSDAIFSNNEIYIGGSGVHVGKVNNPEGGPVIDPTDSNDKPFKIVGNPFTAETVIRIRDVDPTGTINIYSTDGMLKFSQHVAGDVTINLENELSGGIYIVVYSSSNTSSVQSVFIPE